MPTRLPPSLLPDSDEPFADTTYNRGELEDKEYPELRQIAAQHDSDDVHGKMSAEELVNGLEGLERV